MSLEFTYFAWVNQLRNDPHYGFHNHKPPGKYQLRFIIVFINVKQIIAGDRPIDIIIWDSQLIMGKINTGVIRKLIIIDPLPIESFEIVQLVQVRNCPVFIAKSDRVNIISNIFIQVIKGQQQLSIRPEVNDRIAQRSTI